MRRLAFAGRDRAIMQLALRHGVVEGLDGTAQRTGGAPLRRCAICTAGRRSINRHPPAAQNEPKAAPSPITTTSAISAPTMPTITMSK